MQFAITAGFKTAGHGIADWLRVNLGLVGVMFQERRFASQNSLWLLREWANSIGRLAKACN